MRSKTGTFNIRTSFRRTAGLFNTDEVTGSDDKRAREFITDLRRHFDPPPPPQPKSRKGTRGMGAAMGSASAARKKGTTMGMAKKANTGMGSATKTPAETASASARTTLATTRAQTANARNLNLSDPMHTGALGGVPNRRRAGGVDWSK